MKKNIILAAGAVLVVAAVSAFVYVNNEKNSMSDLFNANVEALASNETATGVCYNSITTKMGAIVLYCGTCTWMENSTHTLFSSTGICH